jgi:hypothetical protein
MRRRTYTQLPLALLALCALLSACADPEGARLDVDITRLGPVPAQQTSEQNAFYVASVEMRITNRGTETASLPRCGDAVLAVLEKREGGEWIPATFPVCPAVLVANPLELPPGEHTTAVVAAPTIGTFRAVVYYAARIDDPVDHVARSRPFDVE